MVEAMIIKQLLAIANYIGINIDAIGGISNLSQLEDMSASPTPKIKNVNLCAIGSLLIQGEKNLFNPAWQST
jgi:hypothetical protein